MLWCSVYLYYTVLLNKARIQVLCIADLCKYYKDLKCLIYLGYWRAKHWKYLVFEKDAKAEVNLVELKFAKLSRQENNF